MRLGRNDSSLRSERVRGWSGANGWRLVALYGIGQVYGVDDRDELNVGLNTARVDDARAGSKSRVPDTQRRLGDVVATNRRGPRRNSVNARPLPNMRWKERAEAAHRWS